MATDYARLSADSDPKAIKAAVNLAAAAIYYGIELEPDGNGRLVGRCPFHDDDNPSFAVWRFPDGDWAWGCWPCGLNGDLFDFLRRWHDCDFRASIERALELRDGDLPEAPEDPSEGADRGPAPDMGAELARAAGTDAVVALLAARGVTVSAEWLAEEFRVRSNGGTVLVPHFSLRGELTGMKRREASNGWTPVAVRGCRLSELYGAWRLRGRKEVVLCEGESDTWTMAWLLRDRPVDVLGLPSGVSANPRGEWVDVMRDRRVTVLFDADRAGREGAGRWAAALSAPASGVRVACLPDGTDATSAGPAEALRALDEAWPLVDPEGLPLQEQGGRYVRQGSDDRPGTVVSDFSLRVRRLVVMEGDERGIVFEVEAPGRAEPQFLTGAELASGSRLRRWCADRLLSWKGSERDASDLLELLKARSLTVPRVRGTDVVGLHGDAFVLPDEVVGPAGWGYVPPENDVGLGSSLRLTRGGDWDQALPLALARLHRPDVMTPILGWVAAAPLRSTLERFPVLAVTGGSGWGKTTLVQTVLAALGFWVTTPTTLTGATAHGVHSYAGSTNAFPIWVDEYRRGARPEARLALEQVIRDAWDGSATIKGGMYDNRMRIKKLPARAPLVVTGEDAFSETSHAERMVLVPVPRDGRDPQALGAARAMEGAGFGRAYLEWLLESMRDGTLPEPPDVPDRPRHARAVAAWGYSVLDQFCRDVLGYRLPAFDGSLIAAAHAQADALPPILEAIQEAVGRFDRDSRPIAWTADDGTGDVLVKVGALCSWTERERGDIALPGRSRAVGAWIKEQFGAADFRHPEHGRCLRIPAKEMGE